MTVRLSKCLLLFAIGLFYLLVVFNNTTDYNSNYQFAHHVLMMDLTFPGNSGMWRAMQSIPLLFTMLFTLPSSAGRLSPLSSAFSAPIASRKTYALRHPASTQRNPLA